MKRLVLLIPALSAFSFAAAAAPVDFAREIRPILSDHCFACHGPDSNKRKGGLRLDVKEAAFAEAESGARAIVPGEPEKSELLVRIGSNDPDEVMPPPKEHKKLKPEQLALLRRWIQEGANWTDHWAFLPVTAPVVPQVSNAAWPANGIDGFILSRLEREGLQPSREEDKARLIRRASLDLTGLPPSIQEVDDFLADTSPGAFEKVVDRLLASPHFGERMAIPWLDLARFADTGGYHNDSLRDMWLYREWVIKAFNRNMPFDQFTIEQLAGDLVAKAEEAANGGEKRAGLFSAVWLPETKTERLIASGFHRNVMTSDEGGLIEEEYLNLYQVDRVNTTGTTWLGMTIGCAQCHDHKYDPVSLRDYYQLYAFFHNVPEKGKDGVRDRNPQPVLMVPVPEQEQQLAKLSHDIENAEKTMKEIESMLDVRQAEWEKQVLAQGGTEEPAGAFASFPLDGAPSGKDEGGREVAATLQGEATFVEGAVGQAFRVEAKGHIDAGNVFGFERDQAFSAAAWLRLKPQGGAPFGKMEAGPNYRGWDVEIQGGRPTVHLIHKWPDNAIHVAATDALPFDTFHHVASSYDGSGKAAGVKIFVNGREVPTKAERDSLSGTISTRAPFRIGLCGDAPFTGRVDDLRIYSRTLAAAEIGALGGGPNLKLAHIPADQRTPQQVEQLKKFFRETQATDYLAAKKQTEDLKKEKTELEKAVPNTMVMAEMEKPRDTFIKVRGQYDQNGEKVSAGVPAFLPRPAARADGKPLDRLDLALWLVSKDHPLTARVTVNRWWAMLFGTGLVKTVNDFGSQAEAPSHPELLDWLAADFMRDWDIKRAVKQMVMSATYRQASAASPELLARDSENRLLARGPRHRLDAELIRDNALAIGGLLNRAIGGRSVKPIQPPGIWEINDMSNDKWVKSNGADQYRRGMYVYLRRSTPYPSFITFDGINREVCTAARARTSTPLQSLTLMNDPVYVEAARAFAQRVLAEGGADDRARLTYAWRLTLSRLPTEAEQAVLSKALEQQNANFQGDVEAARKFVAIGDLPKPAGIDDRQLAAWTALANILLNLNETITN